MKIRETLISLLIIGIFSLTTAEPRNPTEEELLKNVPQTADVDTGVIRKWLEEKCNKNGGPGAFESVMKIPEYLKHCMESVVNVRELQMEYELAARRGMLNTVFKKYCERVPSVDKCLRNVSATAMPCLDPKEKEDIEINDNMTSSTLEFICHNDGERIAMFIAADGLECFQSKLPWLELCVNSSFGRFYTAAGVFPDLSRHPFMDLNPEKCLVVEKFRTCAISVLETCLYPTPANLMNSMFNFVKRVTPCEKLPHNTAPPTPADVKLVTSTLTDTPNGVKADNELTVLELQYKSLVKQIEAAEAQVRAANAQEQAAVAQEKAAKVMEQVGKTLLRKKSY